MKYPIISGVCISLPQFNWSQQKVWSVLIWHILHFVFLIFPTKHIQVDFAKNWCFCFIDQPSCRVLCLKITIAECMFFLFIKKKNAVERLDLLKESYGRLAPYIRKCERHGCNNFRNSDFNLTDYVCSGIDQKNAKTRNCKSYQDDLIQIQL